MTIFRFLKSFQIFKKFSDFLKVFRFLKVFVTWDWTLETLITFLTIENNNMNNYIVTFEYRVMVTAFAILAMFSGSDLGKVCWVSKGWHLWKICKASQEADYSNCLKCTVRERSLWWRRLRYEEFWWSPSADFEGQIKGSNALWRKQGIREIKVCKKCPKVNPYCDAIFDPILIKPFLDGAKWPKFCAKYFSL